jgi:hypothetical protein
MTASWRKHFEELFVLIWSWLIEVLVSFIAAYVMFHGFILYGYNSKPVFDDIAYVSSNKKKSNQGGRFTGYRHTYWWSRSVAHRDICCWCTGFCGRKWTWNTSTSLWPHCASNELWLAKLYSFYRHNNCLVCSAWQTEEYENRSVFYASYNYPIKCNVVYCLQGIRILSGSLSRFYW